MNHDTNKKSLIDTKTLGSEIYAIYEQYGIHQDDVPVAYSTIHEAQKDDEEFKNWKTKKIWKIYSVHKKMENINDGYKNLQRIING